MNATTIGEALAAKRIDLGLEKGQAAQRIGMSRTTYSSYEQDAQRPSVEVFPAIAEFLGTSMDEVLALYGATCIVQARTFLARRSEDGPDRRSAAASASRSTTASDSASMERVTGHDEAAQTKQVPEVASDVDGAVVSDITREAVNVPSEVAETLAVRDNRDGEKASGTKKKKKKKKKKV